MSILVVAEHDHASLKSATLSTVAAALRCGEDIHLLVAGSNAAGAVNGATRIAGVQKVIHAEGPQFEHHLAENVARQVCAIASRYSHIFFPATANGKNAAPRVAAILDVAQISEITDVLSPDTFQRPIYAGNVVAIVQSLDQVKIITVRTTAFPSVGYSDDLAVVDSIQSVEDFGKVRHVSMTLEKRDRPELGDAKVIVAGGRALGSRDSFHDVLTPLAVKLGAAIGASRAAVDAGFSSNDLQVGQTGKIVAPDLYIACGISGAIQHLAGIKDSKVIVAINKDPEAPIFHAADYGLVADLFAAIPQLTDALENMATQVV